MKLVLAGFLLVACMFGTASCGSLEKDSVAYNTAIGAIEQSVADGHLTPAQGQAAIQALDQEFGSIDWLQLIISIIGGGIAGYSGVRIQRGKPTQKFGLPQSMVTED